MCNVNIDQLAICIYGLSAIIGICGLSAITTTCRPACYHVTDLLLPAIARVPLPANTILHQVPPSSVLEISYINAAHVRGIQVCMADPAMAGSFVTIEQPPGSGLARVYARAPYHEAPVCSYVLLQAGMSVLMEASCILCLLKLCTNSMVAFRSANLPKHAVGN